MLNHIVDGWEKGGDPTFNDVVIKGMGYTELRNDKSLKYIGSFLTSFMKDCQGVDFLGIQRLSVDEEINSNIPPAGASKKEYDISVTYRRKYRLLFSYMGEPIQGVYLYIPFAIDKGIIISSDTRYHINPVLTDSVITIGQNSIFIRILKDKLYIDKVHYTIIKDGKLKHYGLQHSNRLYKNRKTDGKLGPVLSPINTYIMYKYGFRDCMTVDMLVVHKDNYKQIDKFRDTHSVITSTGKPPNGRVTDGYNSSNLVLLVPREHRLDELEQHTITTIMYVFDVFPNLVKDFIHICNDGTLEDEKHMWKTVISRLIFRDGIDPFTAKAATSQHLDGLENYLDPINRNTLKEIGIEVDDFFHLLKYLSLHGTDMRLQKQKAGDNIYNKYLDVLYYMFYPLVLASNTMVTNINNALKKTPNLPHDTMTSMIKDNIRPRSLYAGFKTNAMSLALSPLSTTTDWFGGGITNHMDLQERGAGTIRNTAHMKFPVEVRELKGGDIYMGSILQLPKDWPTPLAYLNPFSRLDKNYRFMLTTDEQKTLKELNALLKGKRMSNPNEVRVREYVEAEEISG